MQTKNWFAYIELKIFSHFILNIPVTFEIP